MPGWTPQQEVAVGHAEVLTKRHTQKFAKQQAQHLE